MMGDDEEAGAAATDYLRLLGLVGMGHCFLKSARIATERLQHRALHDALTGLPNRRLLQERLEHAARRGQRSHHNAAILFADLDRAAFLEACSVALDIIGLKPSQLH